MLTCKFGSSQLPTTEIVDAIANQLLTIPRNGPILNFFSERFFKIMEENASIYRRPYHQEKMVVTTAARVIKDEDMDQLKSISNLFSVCSWVLGTFICYQPAAEESVNLFDALEMLLKREVKHFSNETAEVFLLSAYKAFVTMLHSYDQNQIFSSVETATQCVAPAYLKQFARYTELDAQAMNAEQRRLERERDERVRNTDFTFLTEQQKEEVMEVAQATSQKLDIIGSVVNMFVKSFDFLVQSLKDFSLVPGLKPICAQLYYYTISNGVTLWNLVQALEDQDLKDQLSPLLERYLEVPHPEGVAIPDAASVGPMLLQVDPEEYIIAQRKIARPEFAFENGGVFSLDNPQGVAI